MSAESVRRLKNRKTNTSLGIPHTFSFPLLPTHECRAVNLHMMTLKILFHMDVKWGTRRSAGHGPETLVLYRRRALRRGCAWARCSGAASIKPFEGSRPWLRRARALWGLNGGEERWKGGRGVRGGAERQAWKDKWWWER